MIPHAGVMPYIHLSQSEREEISRSLARGETLRDIAERLGHAHTTLSRELGRNGQGDRDRYRTVRAERRARRRAVTPRRPRKLHADPCLWGYVQAGPRRDWSPEEISARL